MSEKDVYIGGTSIQIGEHGFINQPKEIIEYIKYLQKELQQKENTIKEAREKIKDFCWDYEYETYSNMTSDEVKELAGILDKGLQELKGSE